MTKVLQEAIAQHEDELHELLKGTRNGLSESAVYQMGLCLDNIKDCYEIEVLRLKAEKLCKELESPQEYKQYKHDVDLKYHEAEHNTPDMGITREQERYRNP